MDAYILFIYAPADGHLDNFHFGDVMNNARFLGLELLGQRVIYVNFIRNCQSVSQSGYAISVPINNARGFQFSTSLPTHVIVCLFNYSHANRWEFISDFYIFHCDFIFYFPNEIEYLPSSYVVTSHSYISFFFPSYFLFLSFFLSFLLSFFLSFFPSFLPPSFLPFFLSFVYSNLLTIFYLSSLSYNWVVSEHIFKW